MINVKGKMIRVAALSAAVMLAAAAAPVSQIGLFETNTLVASAGYDDTDFDYITVTSGNVTYHKYSDHVEVGIMIETPAAAIISDKLAPLVDFFSVGTNDLTQYTLACDRQNARLESFVDTHHEAVLRLIELSAKNAHAYGAWIGICGELAADTSLTETFLRMGIDELSVSAPFVLPLREAVRNVDLSGK